MSEPSVRGATSITVATQGAMIDSGDFPIVVINAVVSIRGATSTTVKLKGE